ncbi:MAG: nucleotidyltransferase family protein [Alphaproteobacteria bacterium]|nr:nucleotidyltransferase family protein [Alphaproteobacteria bacterium]
MSVEGFLARLVAVLEAAGVPYMLSGSLASAYYGIPRSTQDIDIVVRLDLRTLAALLSALSSEQYYVSEAAAKDALRRQGQFNIIDLDTGWKVDLIIRKRRPFSRTEFERRTAAEVLGVPLMICSPEDSILSKLEWARKSGGSERQLRDVAGVWQIRGAQLDRDYIEHWARELGVESLWATVLASSL